MDRDFTLDSRLPSTCWRYQPAGCSCQLSFYTGSESPCGNENWDNVDDLVFAVVDATASSVMDNCPSCVKMEPDPIPTLEPLDPNACSEIDNSDRCPREGGLSVEE